MDYLEYFGLSAEPFAHAPVPRFYYASRQHTDALKRLLYAVQTMKGLAILIGDIGHGKTTLARRLLDSLPQSEFEAAMLVVVHAGVTPNWLLKRIATQLGVPDPADDKLTILSQLYQRLVEIHKAGKRAVVLIDEAQMLATRELMEEFRGLLNLEVPGHKLISFVFFGLPDIENNLRLDPPLAQRVALRYHLKPLGLEETVAYVQHRLKLVGATSELFPQAALAEVHQQTRGVPRVINTLCDNVLLEMYFAKSDAARPELVAEVANNLGLAMRDLPPPSVPVAPADPPAVPGSAGEDAVEVVTRDGAANAPASPSAPAADAPASAADDMRVDADAIAARIASEAPRRDERFERGAPAASPQTTVDIEDPLAFLGAASQPAPAAAAPSEAALPSALRVAPPPAPIPGADDFEIGIGDENTDEIPARPLEQEPSLIKPKLVVPAPGTTMSAAPPADPASEAPPAPAAQPAPIAPAPKPERAPANVAQPASTLEAAAATAAEAARPAPKMATPAAAAPAPQPKPAPKPASRPTTPIRTQSGTIDLDEIDNLLADIKRK